ncbi:MAG: hypothetical protein OEY28_02195, partial [Nitrospira sp.]|nr:hypothetical protein [Nitrospira sp.]
MAGDAGKAGCSKSAETKLLAIVSDERVGITGGMKMNEQDTQRAVGILNTIMEHELAGVVRYTH